MLSHYINAGGLLDPILRRGNAVMRRLCALIGQAASFVTELYLHPTRRALKVALAVSGTIAAAIVGGIDNVWLSPGSKVLYLGAASGTTGS